jgi:hypothetical protein
MKLLQLATRFQSLFDGEGLFGQIISGVSMVKDLMKALITLITLTTWRMEI